MNKGVGVGLFFRILCYILSILSAFAVVGAVGFTVVSFTIGNDSYMSSLFTQSSVTDELSAELDLKLDDISSEYDLNSTVLRNAFSSDVRSNAQADALKSLYSARITPIGNMLDVSKICTTALDEYNSEQSLQNRLKEYEIEEIASSVNEAFDDVYMVQNSEEFSVFSYVFSNDVIISFVNLALAAVLFALVFLFSGRRHKSLSFIAMGFVTAGEISIALALAFTFLYDYDSITLTNISVYNTIIYEALDNMFRAFALVGVALIILGVVIFISVMRYYVVKFRRIDMEHRIENNLI